MTGTNGKTSCSYWIAQALSDVGRKTAVVGTLGLGFPGELEEHADLIEAVGDLAAVHQRITA